MGREKGRGGKGNGKGKGMGVERERDLTPQKKGLRRHWAPSCTHRLLSISIYFDRKYIAM